ncbi:hypothetical protein ABH930_004486 [Kitasatospora sp. GAS204A]|uniref:hypothetical protein n=1 Tax=unclassified Kitasatospora TaxID=2633591 RepID=UPI0024732F4D|nr:hypothetical protein [Kitasatospora sp. GAS204B]MDH6119725.1 hypothetical protein [Kitasatospora sp. GAS204B]
MFADLNDKEFFRSYSKFADNQFVLLAQKDTKGNLVIPKEDAHVYTRLLVDYINAHLGKDGFPPVTLKDEVQKDPGHGADRTLHAAFEASSLSVSAAPSGRNGMSKTDSDVRAEFMLHELRHYQQGTAQAVFVVAGNPGLAPKQYQKMLTAWQGHDFPLTVIDAAISRIARGEATAAELKLGKEQYEGETGLIKKSLGVDPLPRTERNVYLAAQVDPKTRNDLALDEAKMARVTADLLISKFNDAPPSPKEAFAAGSLLVFSHLLQASDPRAEEIRRTWDAMEKYQSGAENFRQWNTIQYRGFVDVYQGYLRATASAAYSNLAPAFDAYRNKSPSEGDAHKVQWALREFVGRLEDTGIPAPEPLREWKNEELAAVVNQQAPRISIRPNLPQLADRLASIEKRPENTVNGTRNSSIFNLLRRGTVGDSSQPKRGGKI